MRHRRVFAQNALAIVESVALEFGLALVLLKIRFHYSEDIVYHDSCYLGVARIEHLNVVAQGVPMAMRAPAGGINGDVVGFVGKRGDND